MKKWFALLLCAMLLLSVCPALADTYYVVTGDGSPLSLRDEVTNEVLTAIPYGVPVVPDPDKSTDICAYVSFGGQSGLVLWRYLSRTHPALLPDTNAPQPTEEPAAPTAAPEPRLPAGSYQLTVTGALIQPAGTSQAGVTSMVVTEADNVVITAQIPKNAKIEGWIINGVHYDFRKTVRILRMTKFDTDFNIEVLYSGIPSETLLTPEAIQAARTGEQLVVETRRAQLSHIKSNGHSGGGWMRSFDFTDDYKNLATGASEKGGQISIRVQAESSEKRRSANGTYSVPKLVQGWKFNKTEVYPNVNVPEFVVRGLNVSMVYEPILGGIDYTRW